MKPYQILEEEWAHFNRLDPEGMVACSSGTAALHLALEALQLPQESEVLCPNYTMIACARAITLARLRPVFVDCKEDLLVDVGLLTQTSRGLDWRKPQVFLTVHVYGRVCNMDAVHTLADDDQCIVVEDLAEAHGVKPHPKTDAACWSFYKNKIVAGEEGGAVWFRNPDHASLARQLRTLGFTDAHDFVHVPRGHNYRMSNAHAQLILANLRIQNGNPSWRREAEGWYDAVCPSEWKMPPRQAAWVYDLRIPGLTRKKQSEIVRKLNAEGIEARMGFWPMSKQPEYAKCKCVHSGGDRSFSDKAADEIFYLPICPGKTTEQDCKRSFEIIRHAIS